MKYHSTASMKQDITWTLTILKQGRNNRSTCSYNSIQEIFNILHVKNESFSNNEILTAMISK